jgi:HK97 family phage major capsid protein
MVYNSLTSRSDVSALIPETVSTAMLGKAVDQSATLQYFGRIPVPGGTLRFPVLNALPVAYWVSGDTGLKQTTEVGWTNKYMTVEEIAVILPIPDNVVADVQERNLWDEAMPLMIEAFGRTLDSAVFFGTNAPASFPTNVVAAATAAGNSVTIGTNNAAAGGFLGDIDDLYGKVEGDGYDVNGFLASIAAKPLLRKNRLSTGERTDPGRVSGDLRSVDGYPIAYPMRGLWPSGSGAVQMIGGAWENFLVGIRQDISMKVLTEAVIQDNTGQIIYNLAQQDMTAVRLTFRVGWVVKNIINNDQPVEASRYPAAVLKNA